MRNPINFTKFPENQIDYNGISPNLACLLLGLWAESFLYRRKPISLPSHLLIIP